MFTKILFFGTLSVLFIGTSLPSCAQQDTEPIIGDKYNSLKVSPTAFFASTFALSYERYIINNMSLQITAGITAREKDSEIYSSSYSQTTAYRDKVTGGFGEAQLRFYLINGRYRLRGLYAGFYGRYNSLKINANYTDYNTPAYSIPANVNYSITSYEGGVVAGYQFVFKNIVVLDLYIGGGIKISESTKPAAYQSYDYAFPLLESQNYTGVTPKGGVRVGFVF